MARMRGMWVWKGRPHPKASPLNSPDLREKNLKSNDNSWLGNTKNNFSPSAALLLRDLPKRKRGLCPGRPLNLREHTPIGNNDVGLHLAPQASFFSPHSAAPVYPATYFFPSSPPPTPPHRCSTAAASPAISTPATPTTADTHTHDSTYPLQRFR